MLTRYGTRYGTRYRKGEGGGRRPLQKRVKWDDTMERAKVTKDVLCEEARFILANVLAEGRYGRQNRVEDIMRICEGAVSVPFQDYVTFLEGSGYLTYDRTSDTL